MKRIQWVAKRLEAWQRWCFGCGLLSSPNAHTEERVSSSFVPRDLLSSVDFSACEIEMAIWDLDFDLKAAVVAYYLWPEKASMETLADRLGITRKCFHDRLGPRRRRFSIASWLFPPQVIMSEKKSSACDRGARSAKFFYLRSKTTS